MNDCYKPTMDDDCMICEYYENCARKGIKQEEEIDDLMDRRVVKEIIRDLRFHNNTLKERIVELENKIEKLL